MKKIFKYTLKIDDEQEILMPFGAEILTVQVQNYQPQIWAIVNPDDIQPEVRKIRMIGTGHPIEQDFTGKYIGTFQLYSGVIIFHVFETK